MEGEKQPSFTAQHYAATIRRDVREGGDVLTEEEWAWRKLHEHRRTHLRWVRWLKGGNEGPPEVGDADFRLATAGDYDRLLSTLQALRADRDYWKRAYEELASQAFPGAVTEEGT